MRGVLINGKCLNCQISFKSISNTSEVRDKSESKFAKTKSSLRIWTLFKSNLFWFFEIWWKIFKWRDKETRDFIAQKEDGTKLEKAGFVQNLAGNVLSADLSGDNQ